jgi:hypothetical protein
MRRRDFPAAPGHFQTLEDAARACGIELSIYRITKPDEIIGAIDAAMKAGDPTLDVLTSPL